MAFDSRPVQAPQLPRYAARRRRARAVSWLSALAAGLIGIVGPSHAGEYMQTFGQTASAHSLDLTADGGYVVAGTDDIWVGDILLGAFVLRLDKDGNRAWSKRFAGQIGNILRANDDGYLVVGGSALTRLDADGNALWRKEYGSDGAYQVQIVRGDVAADGGYLLAGFEQANSGGSPLPVNGWVAKVDADGNPVWQRWYRERGQTYLWSGVQASDSGFVVVGFTNLDLYTQRSGLVMKLDVKGQLIWQKVYSGLNSITSVIRSADDSGFVVMGNSAPPGAWLAKLDSEGEIVWQKTYPGLAAGSVHATSEGGYLMLAAVYDGGLVTVWAKLNARGEILWLRTLPKEIGVSDVRQAPDEGYVIVGNSNDAGALLMRANANGDIPGCITFGTLSAPGFDGSANASTASLVTGVGEAPLVSVATNEVDTTKTDGLRRQCNAAPPNYQGLWWGRPPSSESGWGINFAHQGEVIFATWYTYDLAGKAWWLTMTAYQTANNIFSGTLYEAAGPPLNAVPFNPDLVNRIPVGTGTLTFRDINNGNFTYTVNGNSQTKLITREVWGPPPACVWGAQPNLALATNYQDLWWVPNGAESGWGVNFTHQADIIFATWFTYDFDGAPLWLSATAFKTGTGVYSGDLIRTKGPPFNADPFDKDLVSRTPVGTLTLTFANGNTASYAYTVTLPGSPSVTQTKLITRQIFRPPGTVCQ